MNKIFRMRNRALVQQNVKSKFQAFYPHYRNHLKQLRYPLHPNIVVYSPTSPINTYFEQILPNYCLVNPVAVEDENEQQFIRRIAYQLSVPKPIAYPLNDLFALTGALVCGFPTKKSQALLLDQLINGVNLTIYLRSSTPNVQFQKTHSEVLHYYNTTGTLLEIDIDQPTNADKIKRKIENNIKIIVQSIA